MSEEIIKSKTEVTKANSGEKKKDSPKVVIFREIIAALFWLFLFIKLFVYDIDTFVLEQINPDLLIILKYKFFILLGLLSIIWISIGNKKIFKFINVIVFFPFILFLWRIPKLFWKSKSWIGIFASIGIILTFFNSIKLNFIIFTLISISILFIAISNNIYLLGISMIVLNLYLIYHYIKRFKYAFMPSHIFTIQTETINKYWDKVKNYFKVAEDIKEIELELMTSDQQETWCQKLQFSIILNRVFYFLSSKLRKFQKSRLNVIYYFVNLFYTFLITVIIFAFQNFALYKIEPFAFNTVPKGNIILFFYYSFNTMLKNSINDFYPISNMARLLNSVEVLFAYILLALLFFLITTIVRDKHNEEINTTITTFNTKSKELEYLINNEYKKDIYEAIKLMESIKGAFVQLINYFSENIDDGSLK